MFKRLKSVQNQVETYPITLTVDGLTVVCRKGDSVVAAMLAAGIQVCRTTPTRGLPRGPFCMMGVCFDCLVCIDGRPNQQGCMTLACDGMRVERQDGARAVSS